MNKLHVAIPLGIYSITSAMFFPISQSMVYFKVCLQGESVTGITAENCSNRALVSSNQYLQAEANFVFLISNIIMTLVGTFATIIIGKLGDDKSRKIALVIPFCGLIVSDVTLLFQSYRLKTSPYWFFISELTFGLFGGYGSILSGCFAYASNYSRINKRDRSKEMARLEGAIGVGSVVGFVITMFIPKFGQFAYFNGFMFMSLLHLVCFVSLLFLNDIKPSNDETLKKRSIVKALQYKFVSWTALFRNRRTTNRILILVFSFSISFFAFMGTTHILFYYLKQRFSWDMRFYSFLKAPLQICSTIAILFLYPYLKTKKFSDSTLAIIGLTSRCMGRFWLAIAWSSWSVFPLIFMDMFTKFSPAALRSMLSKSVSAEEQGQIFSLLGVSEMICGLFASLAFHTLFPFSISFFPQLSFVLMGSVVIIPIILVMYYRKRLGAEVEHVQKSTEMQNLNTVYQSTNERQNLPSEPEEP